jgi:phage terminase large subunit-like protein
VAVAGHSKPMHKSPRKGRAGNGTTRSPAVKKAKGSSWPHLLTLIPGYDPYRDAGDCWFDEAEADKACDFFSECLKHIEGALAGQPFVLEPWQKAVVGCLFGWKRPDGTRRYRECLIMVPRKNGKTPLAAGILNYVLFCDNEAGAQIYGAAADIPQASLLFRHSAGMINQEPELSSRCTVYDSYRSVVLNADKASAYKVISGEAKGKHGQNSHLVVVDEEHEQQDRDLIDTLRTSFASANRRQPLFLHVTTAGWDRHSICWETYQQACRVRDGVSRDAAFLPVIFEATEKDDWTSEEVWAKANPNLGVSVSLDYLRRECQKAKENPSYENTFRQLHLNQWTEQAVRWLPMDRWDACPSVLDEDDLRGRACFAGLDLSSTRDITALELCFPLDGTYAFKSWYWVPAESGHVRERQDKVPYVAWSRQGLVELTQSNVVDYACIIAKLREIDQEYSLQGIAIDPWNATGVMTQLEGEGFNVVQFRQGYASMSGPAKEFEKLVVSGRINHGGNPVLRWMAGNVTIDTDPAGNIKPNKAKSTERIDGIVAGIMALGLAVTQDTGDSVYEERGILCF